MLDESPKTVAQEIDLIEKINELRGYQMQTPVLFTESLMRSGAGPDLDGGPSAGGETLPGGYKRFRVLMKSLKRLLKKFVESPHVYFSLDMPSTCSSWSWPELGPRFTRSRLPSILMLQED